MSDSTVNLRILLSASSGNVQSVVADVARAFGGGSGGLGGVLTAVGVLGVGALVGLGAKAVEVSDQFQTAMLQNEAHAGLVASQVGKVTDALMQMGPAVGQGPVELAQALYPILSGFSNITDQSAKTAVSLEELKLASESVAGSTTDVSVVSKAATSAFNAYNLESNNTGQNLKNLHSLFDTMNQTVSEGNMKWDDYSRMIGNFMSKSAQAKVGINEANASLAVFTNTGESAQLAGTHLGSLFLYLGTQSVKMADNAKKLGLHFDAQKFASMDLAQKLDYLQQVTGGNFAETQKLMGGNKTLTSTYEKLNDHIKDYGHALDDLNNAHGATGADFAKTSEGSEFKWKQMQAAAQALGITVGDKLRPVLDKLLDSVTPLILRFTDWFSHSKEVQVVINDISNFIQWTFNNVLVGLVNNVTNLVTWLNNGSGPANAILTALEGIGAAIIGIKLRGMITDLVGMGKSAMDFVQNAGPKLVNMLIGDGGISGAADKTAGNIKTMGTNATGADTPIKTLGTTSGTTAGEELALGTNAGTAATKEEAMGDEAVIAGPKVSGFGSILGTVIGALPIGIGLATTFAQIASSMGVNNVGAIQGINPGVTAADGVGLHQWMHDHHIPGFASGVENFSGGLAYVHAGETLVNMSRGTSVIPAGRGGSFGGGHTFNFNGDININAPNGNANDIASQIMTAVENKIALNFRLQTSGYASAGVL